MKAWLGLAGLGVAVFLVACSGNDPGTDAGTDAGMSADAGKDGGDSQPDAGRDGGVDAGVDAGTMQDAGNQCSGIVTDAGEIEQLFVAAATPVGVGGTIVAGSYDVTAWSVYTGADGGTGPTGVLVVAVMVIEPGGIYRYQHRMRQGGASFMLDTNGTFTTLDGGVVVGQQLCPPGAQPFTSYSTDGTNLLMYSVNPPWEVRFRRR